MQQSDYNNQFAGGNNFFFKLIAIKLVVNFFFTHLLTQWIFFSFILFCSVYSDSLIQFFCHELIDNATFPRKLLPLTFEIHKLSAVGKVFKTKKSFYFFHFSKMTSVLSSDFIGMYYYYHITIFISVISAFDLSQSLALFCINSYFLL